MAAKLWEKGSATSEQVLRFTVGNDFALDQALLPYDCIGSAAHANMLFKAKLITEAELKDLVQGLSDIFELSTSGKFLISPEQEDCHTAIESWLTEKYGDAGRKIHTGRSRNDQVLTASRLYLRAQISNQCMLLLGLASKLNTKYEQHGSLPMAGYTHLQPAMPSSVGMWLQAFQAHAVQLVEEGLRLYEGVNVSPLGAASGFGVPFDLYRDYTAKLLGFKSAQLNPIDVQNSRGRFELRFLNWNAEIGSMLEKFAWDGVIYFSKEFGFLKLPDEFTTGSSIMPQKRNPDVFELLRARGARQRAHAGELAAVVGKLPSNYFRDYQLSKEPVLRSVIDISESLAVLCSLVDALSFDKAKLEQSMSNEVFATYEVYRLVKEGTPFREAYKIVGEACMNGKLDVSKAKSGFEFISAQLNSNQKSLVSRASELAGSIPELPGGNVFELEKV